MVSYSIFWASGCSTPSGTTNEMVTASGEAFLRASSVSCETAAMPPRMYEFSISSACFATKSVTPAQSGPFTSNRTLLFKPHSAPPAKASLKLPSVETAIFSAFMWKSAVPSQAMRLEVSTPESPAMRWTMKPSSASCSNVEEGTAALPPST